MEQRPKPQAPPPIRSGAPEMPPLRYHPPKRSAWSVIKKLLGPLIAVVILLLKFGGKLKFIILPLLKFLPALLKTGGSMFVMIWVYALMHGVWFAVGFVLLIFVHECGHLIAARMLGLKAGAPVFIPFMGAFIALKDAPKNAWIESQVGIGGPLLGAAGALVCYGIYMVTGMLIFKHLAYIGFLLNLFNLAPIGFLDGGRIVTALSPWLWILGTGVVLALMVHHFNFLLLLIFIMSLPRLFSLFRKQTHEEKRFYEVAPGQRAFMAMLYFGLAASLALGMKFIIDSEPALR